MLTSTRGNSAVGDDVADRSKTGEYAGRESWLLIGIVDVGC